MEREFVSSRNGEGTREVSLFKVFLHVICLFDFAGCRCHIR
jgi:hypothetical protein